MGALRTGKDGLWAWWLGRQSRWKGDLNPLVAQQAHRGSPMLPATPISPEQRGTASVEGMEQQAHLPRLLRGAALPLALLAQRTGAATADAGRIHHTETSIGFSAVLVRH
jgi:hypothetical protein